ncbi:MAG TPA: hypothetical protein VM537_08065 [Anaerolineae bacterium]|nr:hypothetical protein [Anaerolineae bacterium]
MWPFDRYPLHRLMIVSTKAATFRGTLQRRRGGYLVLRDAEFLKTGEEVMSIDGELVIPVDKVDFLQVLR